MKLIENQVTLITGATRGIGKGIARKFAEQGSSCLLYTSDAADD